MIQFPETARVEWQVIADAANVEKELRARIARDTLVETELEKLRVRHQAGEEFQRELDADLTPTLEMVTLSDYQSNPQMAPSDLINGVMKDKGLTIMMGPSGSGKSTLALQAVHSLMTGATFLSQPVQKISGGAGVMSYDMDGSLTMDWMAGFPNIDQSKVSVVNAHKRGNPLTVPAMRAQIVAHWQSLAVEVVVVDSFGASFFGENQNDQASVMTHYRDLLKFALTEVGARALLVISHSTAGSPHKIRGSTVHHDVADSIIAVVADEKTGSREVRMVKYRQHRGHAGTMSHQMPTVVIGVPDDVTHLVSLDSAGMTLADLPIPAGMFNALPDTHDEPDITTDSEGDDDL